MKKITIILDERKNKKPYIECAQVIIEDGVKHSRMVTIDSLLEAFTRSAKKVPDHIRIGKIPSGFYDGVVWKENGLFSARVSIVLPKSRQIMQYHNTRYDIPIPSLAFYFSIVKSRIYQTKVFALKDGRPKDESKLFVYPFGNVSVGSGNVCWGANRLKDIQNLRDLEEIVALFLQSECNSDHYRNEGSSKLGIPLRGLFEKLKDQDYFLDEWLMDIKSELGFDTLGQLLEIERNINCL